MIRPGVEAKRCGATSREGSGATAREVASRYLWGAPGEALAGGRGARPPAPRRGDAPPGGEAAAIRLVALMARNNAFANRRLLAACAALADAEWRAPRTGFFPSLAATASHVHWVDRYYLDAVTGGGRGRAIFADEPAPGEEPAAADLMDMQSGLDATLVRFCEELPRGALALLVSTDRAGGAVPERVDDLLLHLFQHQTHHRGQVHAMLSGTAVAPPQLDEFHLALDSCPDHPHHGPQATSTP